jgi:hypothetical protein
VQTVDLHLKPDALHCGVDKSGNGFSKKLRKLTGQEAGDSIHPPLPIPLRTGTRHVIDVGELAKKIHEKVPQAEEFSAAEFALEMIAGAEQVRFCSTK